MSRQYLNWNTKPGQACDFAILPLLPGRQPQPFEIVASDKAKMNHAEGPSISYVNEVVLRGLSERGIRITPDCRITNDRGLSAAEFVEALRERGWSWPNQWYRQNRNYFQHAARAAHFEKEIDPGRWIHIVVAPDLKSTRSTFGRTRRVPDWSRPPRNVELHAERGWLRPSSFRHLWDFVRGKLRLS